MNVTDIPLVLFYDYKLRNNAAKPARNVWRVNDLKGQRWFETFRRFFPAKGRPKSL